MDSIYFLPSHQVEKPKWNDALLKCNYGLVYAHTDFLDHMCDYWIGAVVGNYKGVFPIPYRRKLGVRYVCMPAFSQQLGLFGSPDLVEPHLSNLLKHLALEYKLTEITLNHQNQHHTSHRMHLNLVLPLQKGYAAIATNFKHDLHKNLHRAEKFDLLYEATDDFEQVIELYKQHYGKRMSWREEDYVKLLGLVTHWKEVGRCFARSVRRADDPRWVACALFFKDENRIYNVANTTMPNGRTMEANHVLLHELIKEFAGQPLLLDFEGSDMPGIARFYRKFGPREEWYYSWKSNRLPAFMRWWKR